MKKIIATLGVAAVLTLTGGFAAYADDAPVSETSQEVASSTPTASPDQPISPESEPTTPVSQEAAPDSTAATPATSESAKPSLESSTDPAPAIAPVTPPFRSYEVSQDWYAPRPATVANPFAVPQHKAVLTCDGIKQHDVYWITSAAMEADYAALLAADNLTSPADDAEFTPHDYLVTDLGDCPPVVVPVAPQACIAGGSYHESDDNSGIVTDAGINLRSVGNNKATDFGYLVSGNAQGFTALNWTQSDVTGNGIFFRLIFDLSADAGGPSYASFSGLGTHVDQTTVAGYGSKNVFDGKSLADVGVAYPHNKLVAIMWQTGSSYAKGDGAVLASVKGSCLTRNYVKPPVVVVPTDPTPTTDPTPVVSETAAPVVVEKTAVVAHEALASTGAGDATSVIFLGGALALFVGLGFVLARRVIAGRKQ